MDAPWWSRTFWSTWRCSWRWTAKLIARSRRWCARWDLESLCRRSVSVYSDWMKKVIIRQRKHGDHQRKRGTDIDVAGIDVIGVWNIRQRIQHDAVVIDCEESNDSDDHITSRVSFFSRPRSKPLSGTELIGNSSFGNEIWMDSQGMTFRFWFFGRFSILDPCRVEWPSTLQAVCPHPQKKTKKQNK